MAESELMDTPQADDSGDEMEESALLSCVTPPRGTDVRAVQTEADPVPILLGALTILRGDGKAVDAPPDVRR